MLSGETLGRTGIDAVALEPAEHALEAALELVVRTVTVDYEGIERVALAVGGTQFELLARHTVREVRALRRAGFDDGIACYALVGDVETVRGRVADLEGAGVDRVVAYPARGLGAFR